MVARGCGFARIEVMRELSAHPEGSAPAGAGWARFAANGAGSFAEPVQDPSVTETGATGWRSALGFWARLPMWWSCTGPASHRLSLR